MLSVQLDNISKPSESVFHNIWLF